MILEHVIPRLGITWLVTLVEVILRQFIPEKTIPEKTIPEKTIPVGDILLRIYP